MKTILLALLLWTHASFAADPNYGSFTSNGYRMNSIEYWAHGNYDNHNGVSFGYGSNTDPWSQECARKSYDQLKTILDKNLPEMQALKSVEGPTGIYIIISDWTSQNVPDDQVRAARVWHYNGDEQTHKGGLIKFHSNTKKGSDGKTICHLPTEPQLIDFAVKVKGQIDDASAMAASDFNSVDHSMNRKPAFQPTGQQDSSAAATGAEKAK
jgi:hypothetical protein